jgi:hypothetical protein
LLLSSVFCFTLAISSFQHLVMISIALALSLFTISGVTAQSTIGGVQQLEIGNDACKRYRLIHENMLTRICSWGCWDQTMCLCTKQLRRCSRHHPQLRHRTHGQPLPSLQQFYSISLWPTEHRSVRKQMLGRHKRC